MDDIKIGYCLTGTNAGSPVRAVVPSGGLEVGRAHTCGLALNDLEVSRLHCIVRVGDGKVTVENRSQNGTLVNGKKAEGVTEIKVGDKLLLGSTELRLQTCEMPAPAPAQPPAPADATGLKPGDMIDRYRITRLIGKGGMGTVYEVLHTGLDLPRALKALTLPDDPAYAAFREKFLDEGKMLARLKHDNITQVYDAAYDEKTRTLFFVMDLVLYDDGKPCTLADVAYDECDVSAWFAALASALDYVHGQGIVHSDIKLQNVLVSAGQKIKLADFGVAHLLSGKMRSSLHGGEGVGEKETIGYTAHYVAPEILKANALPSAASDVYALGIMLVRLLTNKWYDECPSALAEIAAKRSLNWRPVLAQMLCEDPKRRVTDLVRLVQQLRHGSKAPVRRKYQVESRRRRSQKVRLQRVPNRTTENLVPTAFAPEPRRNRIALWSVLAGAVLAAIVGLAWMSKSAAKRNEAEQARIEALRDARDKAKWALKNAQDKFADRAGALKDEIDRHRREFAFAASQSRANVTGATERVLVSHRNEILARYADVLKAIADVRRSAADVRAEFAGFEDRLLSCSGVVAVRDAQSDLERGCAAKMSDLEARGADEGRKWSAYQESKGRLEAVGRMRTEIATERSRSLESVRRAIESEPELKTLPELAAAKEMVGEGDRLLAEGKEDPSEAVRRYAQAVASVSNGCARLRDERAELAAIEKSFRACDDEIRKNGLARLRRGELSLAAAATRAKEVGAGFADKWKAECRFGSHTGLVGACSFTLHAQAYYLSYLTYMLNRSHDRLPFTTTDTGVQVSNKRYSYDFSWNAVFSSRKQDTKSKEKYKQMILDICDVPADVKVERRLLVGRWIFMGELLPDANTDEQAERLAAVVREKDGADALAWARRELPDRYPPEAVRSPAAPAIEFADFPAAPPVPQADASIDRFALFDSGAGLSVAASAAESVGISRCLRVRGTHKVRFQIANGEAFAGGTGTGHPFADVEEGGSFDARYDAVPGLFQYGLQAWIEDAWSDGRSLVLVRFRQQPEGQ